MDNSCPRCGKDDQLQSVSAVVSGGTSTGAETSEMWPRVTTHRQTELARQLALPDRPRLQQESPIGCLSVGALAIAAISGFILLFWISGLPRLTPTQRAQSPWIPISIAATITAVFLIVGISSVRGRTRRAAESRAAYERNSRRWVLASELWENLYYCARDGVVFDPRDKSICVPAAATQAMLFP
jgi:hypothetical protein